MGERELRVVRLVLWAADVSWEPRAAWEGGAWSLGGGRSL